MAFCCYLFLLSLDFFGLVFALLSGLDYVHIKLSGLLPVWKCQNTFHFKPVLYKAVIFSTNYEKFHLCNHEAMISICEIHNANKHSKSPNWI